MDVITHYDLLIDENNDSFRDPPPLQAYMDRWDGKPFLEALELSRMRSVLEIGIGTGRIAAKVAPRCRELTGIDISPKTVKRAMENLKDHNNISFICADFTTYSFAQTFDVIYSSLTMMHFENKKQLIEKVHHLLNEGGTFCLSIDKSDDKFIDMGSRRLRIFPDTLENTLALIAHTSMKLVKVMETENAYIIVSNKSKGVKR